MNEFSGSSTALYLVRHMPSGEVYVQRSRTDWRYYGSARSVTLGICGPLMQREWADEDASPLTEWYAKEWNLDTEDIAWADSQDWHTIAVHEDSE